MSINCRDTFSCQFRNTFSLNTKISLNSLISTITLSLTLSFRLSLFVITPFYFTNALSSIKNSWRLIIRIPFSSLCRITLSLVTTTFLNPSPTFTSGRSSCCRFSVVGIENADCTYTRSSALLQTKSTSICLRTYLPSSCRA